MTGPITVRCPAKVNLHLEVLWRRPDGFHELRTLLVPVGLWDEVEASPAPDGVLRLEVEPEGAAPAGEDNLVLQAARLLRRHAGATAGAVLRLRKSIPVAAGLGGGSSDAAGALVALDRLWGIGAGTAELRRMAASLGSDVPCFLVGGPVWGVGRGSEVYAAPELPPWWAVLVPGEEPVSTALVYGRLRTGSDSRLRTPVYDWVVDGGDLPVEECRNDLEPTVVQEWPWVAARLERLHRGGPMLVMVSGSGGTVFALHATEASARSAALEVEELRPLVVPLLSRRSAGTDASAGRTYGDHRGTNQPEQGR